MHQTPSRRMSPPTREFSRQGLRGSAQASEAHSRGVCRCPLGPGRKGLCCCLPPLLREGVAILRPFVQARPLTPPPLVVGESTGKG